MLATKERECKVWRAGREMDYHNYGACGGSERRRQVDRSPFAVLPLLSSASSIVSSTGVALASFFTLLISTANLRDSA